MTSSKFITLAIHSYEYAVVLKNRLESHSIPVELENVDIQNPEISCGVRVRIPISFLPKALHVVENVATPTEVIDDLKGVKKVILIPTDFSDHNFEACKLAFSMASSLDFTPVLMHIYSTAYFDGSLSFSDNFTIEMRDAEDRKQLQKIAQSSMKHFCRKIDKAIADGQIPPLKYSVVINEGVPEECILNYTRQTPPELVVMATRENDKKARELIGSVSAEVLDNSRVPVLVTPEDFRYESVDALNKILFFCSIGHHDMMSMDMFADFFRSTGPDVTLFPVTEKTGTVIESKLQKLSEYFTNTYPDITFRYTLPDEAGAQKSIENYIRANAIKMLVVPNKKRNIFARLLKPGLAHKILFQGNIPLLTLPV